MEPAQARQAVAYIRLAAGAVWALPGLSGRVLGVRPKDQPAVRLLLRLFAIRDVALGGMALQARGEEADRVTNMGILVDAADLAAIFLAASRRQIGPQALLVAGSVAGAALGLGIVGRRPA